MRGEFRSQSGDDDLLHLLVGLGDEVDGRALGLDLDVLLQSFPDFLHKNQTASAS